MLLKNNIRPLAVIYRHIPPYFIGSVKALTATAEDVETYFVQERASGQ